MANEMKCVIIGSVPEQDTQLVQEYTRDAFVICADGGVDTVRECGVVPNLLVGDFDSVKGELPAGVETIRLSTHKDDTDMMYAIKEGFRRGYASFILLGAMGGERFDHSIANISALHFIASHGGKGAAVSSDCKVFLMTEGKLTLTEMKGCIVSVFPHGVPYCNVSYQGLEYPLIHHNLYADEPLGVSNRILMDRAEIILHEGNALVVVQSAQL